MQIVITDAQKKIKLNKKRIISTAAKALKILKLAKETAVSISFVSSLKIKLFNKKYFKKNSLTDVIALGYKGSAGKNPVDARDIEIHSNYLGDIIISPEVALENSKRYNNTFFKELSLYLVHGILHLLGYDDTSKVKREKMRKKETEILGEL